MAAEHIGKIVEKILREDFKKNADSFSLKDLVEMIKRGGIEKKMARKEMGKRARENQHSSEGG